MRSLLVAFLLEGGLASPEFKMLRAGNSLQEQLVWLNQSLFLAGISRRGSTKHFRILQTRRGLPVMINLFNAPISAYFVEGSETFPLPTCTRIGNAYNTLSLLRVCICISVILLTPFHFLVLSAFLKHNLLYARTNPFQIFMLVQEVVPHGCASLEFVAVIKACSLVAMKIFRDITRVWGANIETFLNIFFTTRLHALILQ